MVKPCVLDDNDDLEKSLIKFTLDRLERQVCHINRGLVHNAEHFSSYWWLTDVLQFSENIETVRKESVFSSEVTEDEMDIIAKRVALQQRQFAEYERRERTRKSQKIRAMFDYVSDEEIDEMLEDCGNDEV